jgi:hypothetical protein
MGYPVSAILIFSQVSDVVALTERIMEAGKQNINTS